MTEATYIYAVLGKDGVIGYVGKSDDPVKRLRTHVLLAKRQAITHKDKWFRHLMDNGIEPQVIVLEKVDKSIWQEREMFWIQHYRNLGVKLANGDNGGIGGVGRKLSPEHKEKIAAAHRGKPKKPEAIAKTAAASKGRSPSEETRAKISAALKARPYELKVALMAGLVKWQSDPANIEKLAASKRGKKQSPESIKKRSASLRGKKRPQHLIDALAASKRGIPRSEETKAKLAAAQRGKKHSPESIEKMRMKQQARRQAEKQSSSTKG